MLKKIIACAAFAVTLTCATAFAAEYDGYIVEIAEDTPARVELASVENTGAEKIIDNMYLVDTLEEAENFVDEKYIVNICPNFEFELHDDEEYFAPPNDTYFNQQWGLIKTNMPYAWKTGLNGEGVKIAIIDSGIDADHEDFQGMKITNKCNLCVNSNTEDVKDNYMHGTAVAGIIAAQRNNGIGIAGIADKAEISVIKVVDSNTGTFDLKTVITAIDKAVEFECDIVNMSLGSSGDIGEAEKEKIKKMLDGTAERSKTENGKELIMIASVGNSGTEDISYPAGFDDVIGVASVDEDYNHSSFSQYNDSVFITAPGRNIVVTVPDDIPTTSSGTYNKYISGNGTSFSAPFISATAALAVQAAKKANQEITVADIMDILKNSVDDLGTKDWDKEFGWGVINMKKFIGVLNERYGVEPPEPDPTPTPEPTPTLPPQGTFIVTSSPSENSVTTTITNTVQTFEDISIIGALYDKDGRLVKVTIDENDVIGEKTEFVFDMSDVDHKVREYESTYRIMLWYKDYGEGMLPLTSIAPISIKALYTPAPTEEPKPEESISPEPEVSGAPEPEVSGAPEPEVSGAPEPEVSGAPEPEVSGAPEPEVSGAPEPEVSVSPEPAVSGAPEPEVSGAPEPEVSGAPEPEVSGAPEPAVSVSPAPETESGTQSIVSRIMSFIKGLFK